MPAAARRKLTVVPDVRPVATTRELRSWAKTLPDEFLDCRDLGHHWRSFTVRKDKAIRGYVRVHRCSSCGMLREQDLASSGRIIGSARYSKVEGYPRPAGSGYYDSDARAAVRLESLQRGMSAVAGSA